MKINIDQEEFAVLAPFPKLWEDPLYKIIPLGMHIVESAAYKNH